MIELEGVPDEKMLANAQALGTRLSRLGEYGGQIRAAMMGRQLDEMRRNIGEANAIGPIAGKLIEAQTENDRLRQIRGAIEANKNVQEQQALLAKENQFLRQEIVKLNKTVAGAAELTRRILDGGQTPVEKILGGHMQMPTDHPHAPVAKKLQEQINMPLIIPAFADLL